MNHSNWSAYMYDIHECMRQQETLIQQLISRVDELERKLQNTKSNRIEKVEYHFDQLKIEQLDGTLHIGLSPQDLANLDEDCSPSQVKPPNYQPPLKQTIQAELNDYLHQNGAAMIRQLASEYNVGLDDGFPSIMIQDMIKQLPGRIAFYEKEAHDQNLRTKEDLHAYISDKIKNEIDQSLRKYMDTQR